MPTQTSENVGGRPRTTESVQPRPMEPGTEMKGRDSGNIYLQSDLFTTVQRMPKAKTAAKVTPSNQEAGPKDQTRFSTEEQDASPAPEPFRGSKEEGHQQGDLAPLSNGNLKRLECSTKDETIASLTAKVPPFVALIHNICSGRHSSQPCTWILATMTYMTMLSPVITTLLQWRQSLSCSSFQVAALEEQLSKLLQATPTATTASAASPLSPPASQCSASLGQTSLGQRRRSAFELVIPLLLETPRQISSFCDTRS